MYLRLIRYVLDSFMNEAITAAERVNYIWYVVFVLRMWRSWILAHPTYRAEQFVTYNVYVCIELNAHALISSIMHCRDNCEETQFLVWLFSSQPCESFFRKARSQTSTYCTIVNFSILDFLHRAKRIQAQEDISRDLKNTYAFARQKKCKQHKCAAANERRDFGDSRAFSLKCQKYR